MIFIAWKQPTCFTRTLSHFSATWVAGSQVCSKHKDIFEVKTFPKSSAGSDVGRARGTFNTVCEADLARKRYATRWLGKAQARQEFKTSFTHVERFCYVAVHL